VKKISVVLLVTLMVSLITIPAFAETQVLDPIYPEGGYLETNLADNNSQNWYSANTFKIKSGVKLYGTDTNQTPYKESVTFLKFVVPEFSGVVSKANLTLYTSSSSGIATGEKIEVYRVLDNGWGLTTNKPARNADGSYTPAIENGSQISVAAATAATSYTIDLKSIIRKPGTYSIALKRLSTSGDLKFHSHKPTVPGIPPVINIEVDPNATPYDVKPATISAIFTADDGYMIGSTWYDDTKLMNKTGASPAITFLKFVVPEFSGTVTEAKIRLCVSAIDVGSSHNLTVHKVSNSWDETSVVPMKNTDGTYTPAISEVSVGSVTANQADGVVLNTPILVDVTSMIDGPGTYSVALKTDSTAIIQFFSTLASADSFKRPKMMVSYIPNDVDIYENTLTKDGSKLTSLSSLADQDKLYRSVKTVNYANQTTPNIAVVAQYNGDKLVDCLFTKIEGNSGSYNTALQEVTYHQGVNKIKTFIWRDLSDVKPIVEAITVE